METSKELNVPEGYTLVRQFKALGLVRKLRDLGVEGLRDDVQPVCSGCSDVFCNPKREVCPAGVDFVFFETELLLKGRLLGLKIEGELT